MKLDLNNPRVVNILANPNLSLKEMADLIGVKSIWNVCRTRSKLKLGRLYSTTGLDRPMTNREIKARYNKKRKLIGWKYLYQQ